MCLNVDKELPPLPSEFDTPTGARSTTLAPSSTDGQVNHMEPPHPTLVLEKFPSPVELALISSWHDATAARQVRFQRKPSPGLHLRSFPPPMSEREVLALSTSHANDATQQQRRESFTRKQSVDAQKLEEREPKTSRPTRYQKFLDIGKAARSTPNLKAAIKAGPQMISRSVRFAPCEGIASTSAPTDVPADELDEASQALGIDINDGNIYLTFDLDCRSSRGEAILTFLSPIPNETSNSIPIPRYRTLSEADAAGHIHHGQDVTR